MRVHSSALAVVLGCLLAAVAATGCSSKASESGQAAKASASADAPTAPPSPDPSELGITTRLFAEDVATDSLPLSLAVETLAGVSTVLIPRGTPLPVVKREIFSTATEDQPSVEVHVLQGERPLAVDERSVGRFQLTGIPPAPRGIPKIEVSFSIDARGVLVVSAKDLATSGRQHVNLVSPPAGPLTKADVTRMIAEADAARPGDAARSDWIAARDELDNLLQSSKKLLDDSGAKLPASVKVDCQREVRQAERALAAGSTPGDAAPLREATTSLRKAVHAASESLYSAVPR